MSQACTATLCSSHLFISRVFFSPPRSQTFLIFQSFTSNARLIRSCPIKLCLQPPAGKGCLLEANQSDVLSAIHVWEWTQNICQWCEEAGLVRFHFVTSQRVDFHSESVLEHTLESGARKQGSIGLNIKQALNRPETLT